MSERLVSHLAHYAACHRDRRNVMTHMIGIPLIVLAVEVLLSRPQVDVAGAELAPVDVAIVAVCCYYFTLDRWLAVGMAVVLAAGAVIGGRIAAMETALWLGWGLGLLAMGWGFQFAGHFWEGRRPAFLDDLRSFLIGPLFVLAEAEFRLGKRQDLRRRLEERLAQRAD